MYLTHTITIPELVWSVSSFFGLMFQLMLLRSALQDMLYIRVKKINSIREYSARLTLVTYITWCLVEFVFLLLGAFAMSVPTSSEVRKSGYIQFTEVIVFLIVNFILTLVGYVNNKSRKALVAKIREIEGEMD